MISLHSPIEAREYSVRFFSNGFAVVDHVLSAAEISQARNAIDQIPESAAVRRRKSVYGIRNLLETSDAICELAIQPKIWRLVTPVLGEHAFATRAILFNKTPDANWVLGWHQDSVISVAEQIETPGFLAWGRKAGVWQVQPPPEILSGMLALRIHLDDCTADNGALRVIPGSHRHGWLDDRIADWKRDVGEITCEVSAGGVIAMCPMTLHASSRAISPTQRRVIHIEYANTPLPNGLQWNRRVQP